MDQCNSFVKLPNFSAEFCNDILSPLNFKKIKEHKNSNDYGIEGVKRQAIGGDLGLDLSRVIFSLKLAR